MLFLAIITVATAITEWHRLAGVQIMAEKLPQENACIDWLRARYPDRPLAMWRVNYDLTNHFLENDMRLSNIAADFSLIALPDTIDAPDLVYAAIQAEYASPIMPEERPTLLEEGYQPVTESPPLSDGLPCLYQRETLPYAYSVPLWTLERTFNRLDPILTAPVLVQARAPGRVHLLAAALTDRETVVTAQERAMPGWWAWVDGQPAPLHIAGGQIAVMLPNDGFAHEIVFVYYPPLLAVGGLITLAACVGCMIYLLRGIQARYEISKLS